MRTKLKIKFKKIVSDSHPAFNKKVKYERNQTKLDSIEHVDEDIDPLSGLPKRFRRNPIKVFTRHKTPKLQQQI